MALVDNSILLSDEFHKPNAESSTLLWKVHLLFHNGFRTEMENIVSEALLLDSDGSGTAEVQRLQERYIFLYNCYKFHSTSEDQVVFPALELRVRNVARAYSKEHEVDGELFRMVREQLEEAEGLVGDARKDTVRKLHRTCEAAQISLEQHLDKEEEHVLPLLRANFSGKEQARMLWQLLCSIPVNEVRGVLQWALHPSLSPKEYASIADLLLEELPCDDLSPLVHLWLAPFPSPSSPTYPSSQPLPSTPSSGHSASPSAPTTLHPASPKCRSPPLPISRTTSNPSPLSASASASASVSCPSESASASDLRIPQTSASSRSHISSLDSSCPLRRKLDVVAHAQSKVLSPQNSMSATAASMNPTPASASVVDNLAVKEKEYIAKTKLDENGELDILKSSNKLEKIMKLDENGELDKAKEEGEDAEGVWPPIRGIIMVHDTIRAEIEHFAEAAQRVVDQRTNTDLLGALAEQERFLSALCDSHSHSEEEVLFPALHRRVHRSEWGLQVTEDHRQELSHLAHLRDLVDHSARAMLPVGVSNKDPHASTDPRRRSVEEVRVMREMHATAQAALQSIADHLQTEEDQLLPVVEAHFSVLEQSGLLWRVLLAMPLNVLQRLLLHMGALPHATNLCNHLQRIVQDEGEAEMSIVMRKIFTRWLLHRQVAAPSDGCPAVEADKQVESELKKDGNNSLNSEGAESNAESNAEEAAGLKRKRKSLVIEATNQDGPKRPQPSCSPPACDHVGVESRRRAEETGKGVAVHRESRISGSGSLSAPSQPIDHIFQFHRALRRELLKLESQSQQLLDLVGEGNKEGAKDAYPAALEEFYTRLQFLWGIYRTHSSAEDEIVFPALESKDALHNVSHAYTLDHHQEERLFREIAEVVDGLRSSGCDATSATHDQDLEFSLSRLCAMCTAIRVCLLKHIECEDQELWPLFNIYFTQSEQEQLIAKIIGRSSADVLQVMLPLVKAETSAQEEEDMLHSLSQATRNTNFDTWLQTWWHTHPSASSSSLTSEHPHTDSPLSSSPLPPPPLPPVHPEQDMLGRIAEVAPYLQDDSGVSGTPGLSSAHGQPNQSSIPNGSSFTPISDSSHLGGAVGRGAGTGTGEVISGGGLVVSWQNIYKLNQTQLEAAVRRVSRDPSLDPKRKAYLTQNLLTVRWLVAQQHIPSGPNEDEDNTPTPTPMSHSQGIQEQAHLSSTPESFRDPDLDSALTSVQPSSPSQEPVAVAAIYTTFILPAPSNFSTVPPPPTSHNSSNRHPHPPHCHSDSGAFPEPSMPFREEAALGASRLVSYHSKATGVLGCKHYSRRCQIVAGCCGKMVPCRQCHDEQAVPLHSLHQASTTQMVCMLCNTQQEMASHCFKCSAHMAKYFCRMCSLFDDSPEPNIYHCPFCNLCRRGAGLGIDVFHCMKCNQCMALSLSETHVCRERGMESDCPICSEDLFTSSDPVRQTPCGHFMHSACYRAYTHQAYTCPICSKSLANMFYF